MSVFAAYEPLPVTPGVLKVAAEHDGRLRRLGNVVRTKPTPKPHQQVTGAPLCLLGSGGWRTIVALVSLKHGVSQKDMFGRSRRWPELEARREAMVLIYTHTGLSSPQIGQIFGGRDHTTVLHAMRVMGLRPVKYQGSGKPRKDGLVWNRSAAPSRKFSPLSTLVTGKTGNGGT